MGHAAHHGHVQVGHVREFDGVIRFGEDGLREVFANLGDVDINGDSELDVADVISAQAGVHDAGDGLVVLGVLVIFHSLHEGGGAVADTDNGNTYFFTGHEGSPLFGDPQIFESIRVISKICGY